GVDVLAEDMVAGLPAAGRLQPALELAKVLGQVALQFFDVAAWLALFQLLLAFVQPIDDLLVLVDLLLVFSDALVVPLLGALAFVEDGEDGVDGGEIAAPQHGGAEGTEDGQYQAAPVRQGVAERAQEVLHDGIGDLAAGGSEPGGASRGGP